MTMTLFYVAASPYVRKVLACAIARGIDGQIEAVPADPHSSPAELLAFNPLSKVPALITADGRAVFDSPVICEYLDTIGGAPVLFPPTGSGARLDAQMRHAMGDGILDAAVGRRMAFVQRTQLNMPYDEGRQRYDARQKAAIDRTLTVLETTPPEGLDDIGDIALACALGYLDFRFGDEPWRPAHPRLTAWFAEVERMPPIARTAPKA